MDSGQQAIALRHGVLRYQSTPVERETIEQVLRAAIAAPSPINSQPWALIVVDEPVLLRQALAGMLCAQERLIFRRLLELPEDFTARLMRLYDGFTAAPCLIVLCRQRRAELVAPEYSGLLRDWELCSLGAAMANLMNAATALGLGTRWFGNPMMDDGDELRHLLAVPAAVEIVAATPLGYPDEPPKERPVQSLAVFDDFRRGDRHALAALLRGKLPLEQVVHFNRYDVRQEEE